MLMISRKWSVGQKDERHGRPREENHDTASLARPTYTRRPCIRTEGGSGGEEGGGGKGRVLWYLCEKE
jgi:hypothetical protein